MGVPVFSMVALPEAFIEIDARCNARCFWCDTGNKSRVSHRKSMTVEHFARILDHGLKIGVMDRNTVIYPLDRGEPSLHPDFAGIVRALDARGLAYIVSSNCGMPPRLDADSSLAGMRQFVISMPGWSQASYDRIHQLPFDKVVANIKAMQVDFARRGFTGEWRMYLHVYKFNTHELAPAHAFCRERGIVFDPYNAFFNDNAWFLDWAEGRLGGNVMARAEEELFLEPLAEHIRRVPDSFRCPQYNRITINEDGALLLCCGAPRPGGTYYEGYHLGNFLDMDAEEVMRRKTSSPACERCIKCGAAYASGYAGRPDDRLM